ncbi:MAG: S41 family peptidase, partial [Actinomycetota bacterium]|nr:S41 family peptidase [Actinomycetota bacterium]
MPARSRLSVVPALLSAAVAVVLLASGIWLGGHPSWLPPPIRDVLIGDEDAQAIDALLDTIESDYYRKIDRDKLVDDSLGGAMSSLDDRFSAYFDPKAYDDFQASNDAKFSGVGISVVPDPGGLRIKKVFPRSPAAVAGLREEEVIVAVNGRSLKGKASNVATTLIKGRAGTTVSLAVSSGGRRRVERLKRAQLTYPVVESRLRSAGGVKLAQVELSQFNSGAHGKVRRAVDRGLRAGAKGVVLDLRGNGGGLLDEAVLVSSVFIPEGAVVITDGRTRGRKVLKATGGAIQSRIPVVVLVDPGTASASEIVAGAIQDRDRGKVVGTRTFGKGVFQEIKELPNGGAIELVVGQYFT